MIFSFCTYLKASKFLFLLLLFSGALQDDWSFLWFNIVPEGVQWSFACVLFLSGEFPNFSIVHILNIIFSILMYAVILYEKIIQTIIYFFSGAYMAYCCGDARTNEKFRVKTEAMTLKNIK